MCVPICAFSPIQFYDMFKVCVTRTTVKTENILSKQGFLTRPFYNQNNLPYPTPVSLPNPP